MRITTLRIGMASVLAAVMAAGLAGCSDSRDALSAPSAVAPADATSSTVDLNAVVITILGENGAESFSPNPATVAPGQAVVWYNSDGVEHQIATVDGSVDTGEIESGLASAPMTLAGPTAQYFCADHPDMRGSINTPTN